MRHVRGVLLSTVLVVAFVSTLVGCGAKAAYPEKPINVLVGWPPGGSTDLGARTAAEAIKPFLPQPLVIVNKPGANGTVASAEVATAKPDGYTICWAASAALVFSPLLSPELPYKTADDYTPIIGVNDLPLVLIVRGDSPWKTLQEFVDYAKANPGKVRIAPTGLQNIVHASLELFVRKAGISLVVAPAAEAESVPQLLGGHIEATYAHPTAQMGNLKAGKVRFLAAAQEKRIEALPDVPTFKELGYDVTLCPRNLVHGPKGLPSPIIDTLHTAFKKAVESDAYQKFLKDNGLSSRYMSPEELKRNNDAETKMLTDLAKDLGWVK